MYCDDDRSQCAPSPSASSDQFPRYSDSLSLAEAKAALSWLAAFHAFFWGRPKPDGLWQQGTFWHLDTRQEEFEDIGWTKLKESAHAVRRSCWHSVIGLLLYQDDGLLRSSRCPDLFGVLMEFLPPPLKIVEVRLKFCLVPLRSQVDRYLKGEGRHGAANVEHMTVLHGDFKQVRATRGLQPTTICCQGRRFWR